MAEGATYSDLAWSPSGKRLAYMKNPTLGIGGSLETVSVDGGSPKLALSDSLLSDNGIWLRNGRLIFSMSEKVGIIGENLWSIVIDPESNTLREAGENYQLGRHESRCDER